jgi:uncharacterized protein DUF2183
MTAGLVMKVLVASLTITLAVMTAVFILRTKWRPRVGRVIPWGDGIDHAEQDIEQRFEKHFITAHDGFMAVDDARHITVGANPSAVEHNTPSFKSPWDMLFKTIGWRDRGTKITFSAGSQTIDGTATDREAEKDASLAAAFGQELLAGLNPARVNIANATIHASDTPPTTAKVLVLPRDYDGPIFVSDIDDTLRATDAPSLLKGKRQAPIDGVEAILSGVATMGVPIVYLSAGTTAIHSQNEDFLSQLPPGILLDNQDWEFGLSVLSNADSAAHQAAYKYGVLQKIQETYPKSKPYGIGDDKYGDAIAYTKAGVRAFIHDVVPSHANDPHYVPANFSGMKTPSYTDKFRSALLAEIAGAVKDSKALSRRF